MKDLSRVRRLPAVIRNSTDRALSEFSWAFIIKRFGGDVQSAVSSQNPNGGLR
jgi:hypothetical protein